MLGHDTYMTTYLNFVYWPPQNSMASFMSVLAIQLDLESVKTKGNTILASHQLYFKFCDQTKLNLTNISFC